MLSDAELQEAAFACGGYVMVRGSTVPGLKVDTSSEVAPMSVDELRVALEAA
jgi:hypothetical protein